MLKSYLVIGGSSGIGLTISRELAKKGYRVIVVSSSEEKIQAALNSLVGSGHMAIVYDLVDIEHVSCIFEQIEAAGIKLSGMVYCAGLSPLQYLREIDYRLAENVYRVNVISYIECVNFFADRRYSVDESKIVAIASVTAHAGGRRQTLYGSSKAALISATKLMAKELLERGIRINCLSPGCTDTPMLESLYAGVDNIDGAIKRIQPLGVIPPEAVAQAVLFLLSPTADYLTGSELVYDAGFFL